MLLQRGFEETDRAIWELEQSDLFLQHAGNVYGNIRYTEYKRTASARERNAGRTTFSPTKSVAKPSTISERAQKQRNDDLGGMRVVETVRRNSSERVHHERPFSFTATIIVEAYSEDQAKNIADWAVHLMKTEDRIRAFDLLRNASELHGTAAGRR